MQRAGEVDVVARINHDHGDRRRGDHPIIGEIEACGVGRHLAVDAEAGKVFFQRAAPGVERIRFDAHAAGGAVRMDAPVVQHVRDVDDAVGRDGIDAAQREIVVLRSFEAAAEAADAAQQRRAIHAEVRHHVVAAQQFAVEVGLEERTAALAVFVDLVFVGVQHRGVGISCKVSATTRSACSGMQSSWSINAMNSPRTIASAVFDASEMWPFVSSPLHVDARIEQVAQHVLHARVGRSIVRDRRVSQWS